MPTGTISYRIASETAGIDVDGVRYRATRSSRIPEAGAEGARQFCPEGRFTLGVMVGATGFEPATS